MLYRLVKLLLQEGIGISIEFVAVFVRTHQIDLVEFFTSVIGKVNEAGKTRTKTWVGIDETLHLVLVTCHDDHQVVAIVLHALEQRSDSLSPIIVTLVFGQGVSLVDKEHTTQCRINQRIGLGSRLPNVFADKARTVSLDQMSRLEYTEVLIDASQDARHCRFTCTWAAAEDAMISDGRVLQPLCLALLLHLDDIGQGTHFGLHVLETDQRIEFFHRVALDGFGLHYRLLRADGRLVALRHLCIGGLYRSCVGRHRVIGCIVDIIGIDRCGKDSRCDEETDDNGTKNDL